MTFVVPTLAPLADDARTATRQRWASRAIPPGALGRLIPLAESLAATTGVGPPAVIARPAVAVFAGDHGVVADGASAWPAEITTFMADTMAAGGAAINQFAALISASVTVVDVGMASAAAHAQVVDRNVRRGTASLAHGPAMSDDNAHGALTAGFGIANDLIDAGADCFIGGEMGIGNTTAATAIIAACTGRRVAELVGPGAGLPPDRLAHKAALIERGIERLDAATDRADRDGFVVLREIGGLEIGALAGSYLAATARRVPVVIDGVIALAALCLAERLAPGVAQRVVAGHRSSEPAASAALEYLALVPLLDLDLRLGEGTGACLAVPLLQAAARAVRDIADLPT